MQTEYYKALDKLLRENGDRLREKSRRESRERRHRAPQTAEEIEQYNNYLKWKEATEATRRALDDKHRKRHGIPTRAERERNE